MELHNNYAKEWGALSAQALNPLYISYQQKINIRTVQGERSGAGARIVTGCQERQVTQYVESATGQTKMPDESRSGVSVHFFWKWGISALFGMYIVNLDAGSCLCQTSAKSLATAKKEKKYKYLQTCLKRRPDFTPMVYSADTIPGTVPVAA